MNEPELRYEVVQWVGQFATRLGLFLLNEDADVFLKAISKAYPHSRFEARSV